MSADLPRSFPAVTQLHRHAVTALPRLNPGGPRNPPPLEREIHEIRPYRSMFASAPSRRLADSQALGCCRAHEDSVLPGDFRQRLWCFLEPAVVREATVEDGRIETEGDFNRSSSF